MEGKQMSAEEAKLNDRYINCKRMISVWENAFFKSNQKRPDRDDFLLSPQNVRLAYKEYCKIKKILADLKNGIPISYQPSAPMVLTPDRRFMSLRSDIKPDISQIEVTPEKGDEHRGSASTTPASKKFYKRMSSRLLEASFDIKPKVKQETIRHDSGSGAEREETDSSSDITATETNKDVDETSGMNFNFSGLKNSKRQLFVNNKEKTSNLSVMSEFWRSTDGVSPVKGKRQRPLRQIDSGWLQRCDQQNDSESELKIEPEQSTLNVDSGIIEDVMSSENENSSGSCSIVALSEASNSQTQPPKSMELVPVSDSEMNENTLFEQESESFVMDMDVINDIVNEVSKTVLGSSTNDIQPIDLDPFAFNPPTIPITPLKENPNMSVSEDPTTPINPNKRSSAHLSPNPLESEEPGPKRKFFKSSRLPLATSGYAASLRKGFRPPSPKKKKKSGLTTPKRTINTRSNKNLEGQDLEEVVDEITTPKTKSKSKAKSTKSKSKKSLGVKTKKNAITNSFPTKRGKTSMASSKKKSGTNKFDSEDRRGGSSTAPDANTMTSDIYEESGPSSKGKGRGRKKRVRMSNKEYLQMKVNRGTVNENFVRVDLTKKIFVRGHKKVNSARVKRLEWKVNKSNASREAKIMVTKCKKCGDIGHFAKFCLQGEKGLEEIEDCTELSPFPTLQEAARMVFTKPIASTSTSVVATNRVSVYETQKAISDSKDTSMELCATVDEACPDTTISNSFMSFSNDTSIAMFKYKPKLVDPFFSENNSEAFEAEILQSTLSKFGYPGFRPGQQEAITRTLRGLSTLVILSTGSGKSLCYQLPAYLYSQATPGAITLCISPLVSLMEDQVAASPPFLHMACLHTMMTVTQREKVLEKVRERKLQILLVSPEAICSGLFGLLRDVETFPPVAFACIDEVHCVSEWSHNFRPSYLKLCKILRDKLCVPAILGLTATSTNRTSNSICDQLLIDPLSVIRGEIIPLNLNLSVSRDFDRDDALLFLLTEGRFKTCESIIIYCTRREECERVSTLIRTKLQYFMSRTVSKNPRQRISDSCEAYHAGMSGTRRKRVQNQFMAGNIRIVVATVAFGMGIDKSDIRAVIHYNMPKTFESYVQEIGRAGRDGEPAHCHLFLDNVKGKDLGELKRHVYANSVDRGTIRKLIKKIFKPCKCAKIEMLRTGENGSSAADTKRKSDKPCPGHEVSFSVAETTLDLDLPEENIETWLCYLELDSSRKWVDILPKCYQLCKIQSYGGSKLLRTSALKCPALAAAIAILKEKKSFKEEDAHLEFNLVTVAATVGWSSGVVRRELKKLEWAGTEFSADGQPTKFRKSGLLVEFSDLAYRMIAPGDLKSDEYDQLLDLLHGRNLEQERTQLFQLHLVHQALFSVSTPEAAAEKDYSEEKCEKLKKFIFDYFHQSSPLLPIGWKNPLERREREEDIRNDTRSLLRSQQDVQFTGRAVARIFQGISSPCFPSEQWCRNRAFWRRYIDLDFHFLSQIAGQEIIAFD